MWCLSTVMNTLPPFPHEEKVCEVCTNKKVEDETLMLFNCTIYITLREHFLIKQHILNTTFDSYHDLLNTQDSQQKTKLGFVPLQDIYLSVSH